MNVREFDLHGQNAPNRKSVFIPLVLGLGLAVALIWLLGPSGSGLPVARAASYTVCPAGPPACAYSVIQDAVDVARNGDLIKVAAGTYDDVNHYFGLAQVVYLAKSVTIRGGYTTAFSEPPNPVANPTTLDAGGRGRVIYAEGNISLTLEGLRITGGDANVLGGFEEHGGGVSISNATVTLRNNRVFNNTAYGGGGLWLVGCDATLISNTVLSNTATDCGGGLIMFDTVATIDGNTVLSNTSGGCGGGISLWECDNVTLTGNTISANSTDWGGGGVRVGRSHATLVENIISSNISSDGGLGLDHSTATITNNTIVSNTGGGVNMWDRDNVTLVGNTISHNKGTGVSTNGGTILISGNTISHNSTDYGGGMSVSGGSVTIRGNTISFNSVTEGGGGVWINSSADGEVTFTGNVIANNTAAGTGGGLFLYYTDQDFPARLVGNVIANNSSAGDAGGVRLDDRAELINNLIVDNQATRCCGTGVSIAALGSVRMVHNTIARNTGGGGIGVALIEANTVSMTNNILISHTVGIRVDSRSTATLDSTLWGNDLDWEVGGTIAHNNDRWGDPDFVDADHGDYHLGGSSAALDAGVDAGVTTDIDFHPRPYLLPDLGADEYWPPGTLSFIYLPLVRR